MLKLIVMKFKKVEISAVRIYNDPKDSTFDFTYNSVDTANFISLYAPNGFGKTSFYDSVEWGITNNISRFSHDERNTEKSVNSQYEANKRQQVELLRCNIAPNSRKTYVKITPEEGDVSVRRLKIHGRKKVDAEKICDVENSGFKKVILSQEWIASFLKEYDGEERYKKFIDFPELEELDRYYKSVKALIRVNLEDVTNLKSRITELQANVDSTEENNVLEKINILISKLSAQGEKIEELGLSSTKEAVKQFRDEIAPRVVALTTQEEDLITKMKYIESVKDGNPEIIGTKKYFEDLETEQEYHKQLKQISDLLDKFKELSLQNNKLSKINTKYAEKFEWKDNLIKILDKYSEYQEKKNLIIRSHKEYENNERDLLKRTRKLNSFKRSRDPLNFDINKVNLLITETSNKLTKLPEMSMLIKDLSDKIKKIKSEKKISVSDYSKFEDDKTRLDVEMREYNTIIEAISSNQYSLIRDVDFIKTPLESRYKDLIKANINSLEKIRKEEYQQKVLSEKILKQESLNSNVTEFIKEGLKIVEESETSTCPLCSKSYESYEVLAKNISSNGLLDELLKELLKEQTKFSDLIRVSRESVLNNNKLLIDVYKSHLSLKTSTINGVNTKLNKLKDVISVQEARKNELNTKLLGYNEELNNQSVEKYKKYHEQQNKYHQAKKLNLESIKRKNDCLLDKTEEIVQILLSRKLEIGDKLAQYRSDEGYVSVIGWFKENKPDDSVCVDILNKALESINKEIKEVEESRTSISLKITGINTELISCNKPELLSKSVEIEKQRVELVKEISTYKSLIVKILKIDSLGFDENKLLEKFSAVLDDCDIRKRHLKDIKEKYLLLEKYGVIIDSYLESERSKYTVRELVTKMKILDTEVRDLLLEERNRIKSHLEKKIQKFFYTGLINKIYKKIDPHPDFKKVEFRVDLESEIPSLDVFVTDIRNDRTLIPNLYFSTAQINVLSLSIFLASALQSKEYDCIFIDDPIQSMDSINVLSTVDLFRSIIVNYNKQIILSTHDKIFHNLLKKKIPNGLFKSKYLELQSFGKLK